MICSCHLTALGPPCQSHTRSLLTHSPAGGGREARRAVVVKQHPFIRHTHTHTRVSRASSNIYALITEPPENERNCEPSLLDAADEMCGGGGGGQSGVCTLGYIIILRKLLCLCADARLHTHAVTYKYNWDDLLCGMCANVRVSCVCVS